MTNKKLVRGQEFKENELQKEKLLTRGVKFLNDSELLAILLENEMNENSALHVAQRILAEYKNRGIYDILNLSPREFSENSGINMMQAVTLMAALEFSIRITHNLTNQQLVIRSSKDVVEYVMPRLRYKAEEYFMIMLLNAKGCVLSIPTISVGCLSAATMHPRNVFNEAIKHLASSMILIHNHPSGDPTPSKEDLSITEKLVDAGRIMDIVVLDHIIIGDNKYISIKEKGLMD